MTEPRFTNYRGMLALDWDGRWHIHPGAQSLDLCLLPVHLEVQQSCLTCRRLQHRYEEFKQFSQDRDIVCKVQIGVRVFVKGHTIPALSNRPFQHQIHTCSKWIRCQHALLAHARLNFQPWTLNSTCPDTAERVVIESSNQSDYLVWDTNSYQKWPECGSAKWVESSMKVNVCCKGRTTVILPSLCDIVQSNYAIACGATWHKTTAEGLCETRELVLFLQEWRAQTLFLAQRAVLFLCSYSTLTLSLYLYRLGLLCVRAIPLEQLHPFRSEQWSCAVHACMSSTMLDVFWIDATWSWCLAHFHPVHGFVCFHDCGWGGANARIWCGCSGFWKQGIWGR